MDDLDNQILAGIISLGHVITDEHITLYKYQHIEGNTLNQLVSAIRSKVEASNEELKQQNAELLSDAERYRKLKALITAVDFDYEDSGNAVMIFEMPKGLRYSPDVDFVLDQIEATS